MDDLPPIPGTFIREKLEAKGWDAADLAAIIGVKVATIRSLLNGKTRIRARRALELSAAIGDDAFTWMKRQNDYDLARAYEKRGRCVMVATKPKDEEFLASARRFMDAKRKYQLCEAGADELRTMVDEGERLALAVIRAAGSVQRIE